MSAGTIDDLPLVDLGYVVPEALDLGPQLRHPDLARVVDHRRPVGGEVDVGLLDALEATEPATDARGATGAGHALDRKIDACRCGSGRGG
jgi:hypothetical protein